MYVFFCDIIKLMSVILLRMNGELPTDLGYRQIINAKYIKTITYYFIPQNITAYFFVIT